MTYRPGPGSLAWILILMTLLSLLSLTNGSAATTGYIDDSGIGVYCNSNSRRLLTLWDSNAATASSSSSASRPNTTATADSLNSDVVVSLLSSIPNPFSLIYFPYEGVFRINMTSLSEEGFTYADIQLIKRVPWVYSQLQNVLETEMGMAVLTALAPFLDLVYGSGPEGGGGGDSTMSVAANRFRDRIENSVVLSRLSEAYDDPTTHKGGELVAAAEWRRLPPPCTSRAAAEAECLVRVDPLADVCIVLQQRQQHQYHRRNQQQRERLIRDTNADVKPEPVPEPVSVSVPEPVSVPVVLYSLVLPRVDSDSAWLWSAVTAVISDLSHSLTELLLMNSATETIADSDTMLGTSLCSTALRLLRVVVEFMSSFVLPYLLQPAIALLGRLPLALVRVAAGVYIFLQADDLVSKSWVQSVIMVSAGLAMSVLTFIVMIFSFFKNMLPQQIPFANSVLGLLMLLPAALLGNSTTLFFVQKFFVEYILIFWQEGLFGVRWLGKLYAGVYILGCFALARYFRVFGHDTYTRWCVVASLQAAAAMLIIRANPHPHTNNTGGEFTWALVLCLYIYDYLSTHCSSWYVHTVGYLSKSTLRYSGRRAMTSAEFEAEGRYYTEKALQELQAQLCEDSKGTQRISDRLYKDGKHLQASMLKRFANGDYSGLPELNSRQFGLGAATSYFVIPKYVVYRVGVGLVLIIVVAVFVMVVTSSSNGSSGIGNAL